MKPGDVVQLKSGGPRMTIMSIEGEMANCSWFRGYEEDSAEFPIITLNEQSVTLSIQPTAKTREFLGSDSRACSNEPASVEEQVEQAAPKEPPFYVRKVSYSDSAFEVWKLYPQCRVALFIGPHAKLDAKAHAERLCRRHKVTGE